LRFEIGRKLEGIEVSRPGFLRRGVTEVLLKHVGKTPSEKERFARVEMRSEKTELQDLRREVGMKSIIEDFAGNE